jgi:hypothetical protein
VNEEELARIRGDIIGFANSWDPRLFDSVASPVADIQPEIDLYEELRTASQALHQKIIDAIRVRPPSILDDEADTAENEEEDD